MKYVIPLKPYSVQSMVKSLVVIGSCLPLATVSDKPQDLTTLGSQIAIV